MKLKINPFLALTGLVTGALAVFLMLQGNPGNMGFCIACFMRDTAGALKLHTAPVVQYLRPELIGLVLGSFALSLLRGEFKVRGGSSPLLRFVIGFFVMINALVFLGCSLRMVLRMAAGDLNAWIALIGFVGGIAVGSFFMKKGFSLKRAQNLPMAEGLVYPVVQVVFLLLLVAAPAVLAFSKKGPGSMHAPLLLSLVVALVIGALAQHSRICMVGSFRDIFLFKDFHLFWGSLAILLAAAVVSMATGKFHVGMLGQPIATVDTLWNILSMFNFGLGCVLIGGCPLRHTVLSGTGNTDSAVVLLGMLIGAAFAHNFGLASGPSVLKDGVVTGGSTPAGRIAVVITIVLFLLIAVLNTKAFCRCKTETKA